MSFTVDTVAQPLDPHTVDWGDKEIVGIDHSGAPHYSVKRKVILKFGTDQGAVAASEFATLKAHDDGATHTVQIPTQSSLTYTTYTGVYIRVSGRAEDINFYDTQMEISWIEA